MGRYAGWGIVVVSLVTVALLVAQPAPPVTPPSAEAQAADAKYTGLASCAGSSCHSKAPPRAEYPRLNENLFWLDKDKHAKAFHTLSNEKLESKVSPSAIARKLKIAKANTSERCLSCHAVNVKPELRGPSFDIADGVHCDGCHGPASSWLKTHDKPGWTHEQSVQVGMYDTKNLFLRAEKCVSCHLQIEAEVVAAGHPDLAAFELDGSSQRLPPHWRDRGTWFGAQAWATGQVVSLREAGRQLGDRAKSNVAPNLLDDAVKKVRGHGALVRHIFAVLFPDAQKSFDGSLAEVTAAAGRGDRAALAAASTKVTAAAVDHGPKVAARALDQALTRKLIDAVAADADGLAGAGIRAAEQTALTLDRLTDIYARAQKGKRDPAVKTAVDRVFGVLEEPTYDPKKFAAEVKGFQRAFK